MSHPIVYKVDGEPQSTNENQLTANQILSNAGLDPANHYLVEIKGKHQESYEGKGNQEIHLHNNMVFVSTYVGPTPVSEVPTSGPALYRHQLEKMGYTVQDHGEGKLSINYQVDIGPKVGTECRLGVVVPSDFPFSPPSGPHFSERFHPNCGGGAHPTGGIHDSSAFGTGWEYWSRPFNDWPTTRRTVAEYLSFVRGLWATQ